MATNYVNKIFQHAAAGDTETVMDLISDFVEEEHTTYSKVQMLIKQLRRKNVKDFEKIRRTLVEESEYLRDTAPLTIGSVLRKRAASSPFAQKMKAARDTGTVLTQGTIAEKLALALGVSDKEDLAEGIRKRHQQKAQAKRSEKKFQQMSTVEKFKHLRAKTASMDEDEDMDEIDTELDKLFFKLKEDVKKTKQRIDELESEINKATGQHKKELELQLQKTIEELESTEALFGEPEDSPLLKKAKKGRKHKLSAHTRRVARIMNGFDEDEDEDFVLGSNLKNRGNTSPRDSLLNVKVTTRQSSVLFNRKPLGISPVDASGKPAANKAAEATYEQTEYQKKKAKLDDRKHEKERIDDRRFLQKEFDEVEEDEGGGGSGLLEMLGLLLAFLGRSFLPAFKLLFKSLWELGKVLGRFSMRLPIIGSLFRKANEFLFGKRGLRDARGRFIKRENVAQRVGKGFKGSKFGKLLRLGGRSGKLAEEAGGVSRAGGIVGGAGAALEGGEALAAGGAEVAGTAAVGGEAAGGAVALASNPIGWIIAAVLGAAVAAFLVWKYIIPKKWKAKIEGVLKDVGHAAVKVWHGMEKLAGPIKDAFAGLFHVFKRIGVDVIGAVRLIWKATEPIRNFFKNILLAEIRGAWHAIQTVGSWFGKAFKGFKSGLEAIKNVLMPIFHFIGHAADIVKHALGKAWDWLEDHVPGLKTATKVVKDVTHAVKQGAETAVHTVVNKAKSVEHELHESGKEALGQTPGQVSKPVVKEAASKQVLAQDKKIPKARKEVARQVPVQAPIQPSEPIAGQEAAPKKGLTQDKKVSKAQKENVITKPHTLIYHFYNPVHPIIYMHAEASRRLVDNLIKSNVPAPRTPAIQRTAGSSGNQQTVPVVTRNINPVIHVHVPAEKSASATRTMPISPLQNIPTLDNTPAIIDDNGLLFLNLSAY